MNHNQCFHSKVELGDECEKQLSLGNFALTRRIMNKVYGNFFHLRVLEFF